jgi:hypothetical protein
MLRITQPLCAVNPGVRPDCNEVRGRRCMVLLWPASTTQIEHPDCTGATENRRPRFGRYEEISGREADIGFRSRMTQSGHERLHLAVMHKSAAPLM